MCNEIVALKQRHQLDDGSRYTSGVNLRNLLKPHIKSFVPTSYDVVISHSKGGKKRLLEQAKDSLELEPLCARDGRIRMFLKDDKSHEAAYGTPRCIQYRSKRYCLPLATYLIPLESYVYSWLDEAETPIFAKCRNMVQRGQDIEDKMSYFNDPVAISLDHSKFDSHVNTELLRVEHWFYNKCYNEPELGFLLNLQLTCHGTTKNGTRYKTVGTRMSGDQNTGLGNSLINYVMTYAMKKHLNIPMLMYIDGDDFIIFVERSVSHLVTPDWYKQFGMVTKVDNSTSVIEEIEFCQSRPVFNGVGYTMVRNPLRMLARLQWMVGKKHPKHVVNYLTSIGLCMMSLGVGLPVEQYVGSTLASLGGRYIQTDLHYRANKMKMKPGRAQIVVPSDLVRSSYYAAWGITPDEQMELEKIIIREPILIEPTNYEQYPLRFK